jgi:hypothetical protein
MRALRPHSGPSAVGNCHCRSRHQGSPGARRFTDDEQPPASSSVVTWKRRSFSSLADARPGPGSRRTSTGVTTCCDTRVYWSSSSPSSSHLVGQDAHLLAGLAQGRVHRPDRRPPPPVRRENRSAPGGGSAAGCAPRTARRANGPRATAGTPAPRCGAHRASGRTDGPVVHAWSSTRRLRAPKEKDGNAPAPPSVVAQVSHGYQSALWSWRSTRITLGMLSAC